MPKKNKSKYQEQMPVIEDDIIGIGTSTDFSKVIEKLYSDENVKMKTDLSSKQICKLNIIRQMAEYYDVDLLKELYHRFISLRVSLQRKGRKEAVSMTQQIMSLKSLEAREKFLREGVHK